MGTSSTDSGSVPVAPDSVRVFRGFKLDDLPQKTFFEKLGSIFIPGTVQIQAPVGLTAYMPSVMPADHHPSAPDEIALVFYEVQQDYDDAKLTVGGRAYSDLHKLAFDMEKSFSGWPKLFEGEVEPDEKYYLFEEHIDWQHGSVHAFVGVRSGDPQEFNSGIAAWLKGVQSQSDGPDGAIAVASTEHVVYWEHWPGGQPGASRIPDLKAIVETVYDKPIQHFNLYTGLWEPYKGVGDVAGGETFNFRFKRRKEY